MATKNFYLDAYIDGRKNKLSGGPSGKEGGFELDIKMSDEGQTPTVVKVLGYAYFDGELRLEVRIFNPDGSIEHEHQIKSIR